MLRQLLVAALIGAALPLVGCASTAQMQVATAANQPITAALSKQSAKDAVAELMVGKGYRITKDSDFVLEFSVPTTNGWAQLLLSSNYDSQVDARIDVQFVGDNPTTVSWRAFLVTNPGSSFERLTDVSKGADAPAIQAQMQQALSAAEAKKPAKR